MKLALLLFTSALLGAQTMTPDQVYGSLQAILADRQAATARIISQQVQITAQLAQIADLSAKLAAANSSCVVIPQPWQDIIRQILASGGTIAAVAHVQNPTELAEWDRITGKP